MYAFSVIAMNVIVLATPSSKRLAAGAVSSFFLLTVDKKMTDLRREARKRKRSDWHEGTNKRSFARCGPLDCVRRAERFGEQIFFN